MEVWRFKGMNVLSFLNLALMTFNIVVFVVNPILFWPQLLIAVPGFASAWHGGALSITGDFLKGFLNFFFTFYKK